MAHGGPRNGAGRKTGAHNIRTAAKVAEIEASGLTPLDYMLEVLRDPKNEQSVRMQAAKDAAPYVHPRLAAIEHTGKDGGALIINVVRFAGNHAP